MAEIDYTPAELMACVFSREIKDGEVGGIPGVRSEVPLASVGLAIRTHAPNITVYTVAGVVPPEKLFLTGTTSDYERYVGAEYIIGLNDIFDLTHKGMYDWWWAG